MRVRGVGIAILVALIGVSCGSREPSRDEVAAGNQWSGADVTAAYRLDAAGVPEGFEAETESSIATRPEPSITQPVVARWFRVRSIDYLRLDGSHDALEAWIPRGVQQKLNFSGGRGSLVYAASRFFLLVAKPDSAADVVSGRSLIIGPYQPGLAGKSVETARGSFLQGAAPLAIAGDVAGAELVRQGEVSGFVNAVPGRMLTYHNAAGATIVVHTFGSQTLEPVMDFFAAEAKRVEIAGKPSIVFESSGEGGIVIATTGDAGELVLLSAAEGGVSLDELLGAAATLVKE